MNNLNLKKLKLRNFRSHKSLDLDFYSHFIYFSGPNGVGKTNILEAISLFSPGRGLRGANVNDLIKNNSGKLWDLFSIFKISNILIEIEIGLDDKGRKNLRIDGKKKPLIFLTELFKIIWITPLMDRLWIGGSSDRRRFLDRLVMNFFPKHAKNCIIYEQALKKRNFLLKENEKDLAWFSAIEKQLALIGYQIDKYRREVIELLIEMQINMKYQGYLPILNIELDTQPIKSSEELLEEFQKSRQTDLKAKRTLIGPHKTDLLVSHSVKNIQAKNCSTGDQKSLLLSFFILSSLAISKKFGKPPIILLDEIVAHLDKENLSIFLQQLININAQIFATGTDIKNLDILPYDIQSYSIDWSENNSKVLLNKN